MLISDLTVHEIREAPCNRQSDANALGISGGQTEPLEGFENFVRSVAGNSNSRIANFKARQTVGNPSEIDRYIPALNIVFDRIVDD